MSNFFKWTTDIRRKNSLRDLITRTCVRLYVNVNVNHEGTNATGAAVITTLASYWDGYDVSLFSFN